MIEIDRSAWKLQKWGLYIAGGLAWVVAICVVLLTLTSFHTADQTTRIEQGNRLASCRATHRLVVDDALATLAVQQSNLLNVATQAQAADLLADDDAKATALASMPQAQADVVIASKAVQATTVEYSTAIGLSQSDPGAFLRDCPT